VTPSCARLMAVTVSVCLDAPEGTRTLSFDAPRIVIGRSASCDVRLPDRSVSQHHATIRQERDHYVVVDEASTNGTYVNGERLPSRGRRILRGATRIRTGRIQIEVQVAQAAAPSTTVDETRALALEIVAGAGWIQTQSPPVVTATEGPDEGKSLTLEERDRVYRLGRSPDADLELTDEDASREHVELRCDNAGVWVRDCGSKNGTVLNDRPLPSGRSMLWEAKLPIRIGETGFALKDAASAKLSELTDAPDERISNVPGNVPDDLTFGPRSPALQTPMTPADAAAAPPASATDMPSGTPPAPSVSAPSTSSTTSSGARQAPADGSERPGLSPTISEDGQLATPAPKPAKGWRIPWLDLSIVVLALLVLAASVVGIYWLFSGN
jgi:pSer/pThr/pTyr-binding forkhead associated (FHA) protein